MTIEFTENSCSIKEDKNVVKGACDLSPNESLLLSEEKIGLKCKEKEFSGNGQIWLKLLPKPSIQIKITFPKSSPDIVASLAMNFEGTISIPSRNISSSVSLIKRSFGSNQALSITAIPQKGPLITMTRGKILTTIFNLFNFWDFLSTGFFAKHGKETYVSCNRAILISEEWKVTVESLPTTKERTEILKNQGGYSTTHVGQIEKVDGSLYRSNEADKILEALSYFFSFVRGFWVHPQLPIGFNRKKNRVWEVWVNYHVNPWQSVLTWFDANHGNFLSDLFPGFMRAWNNPLWQETIKAAIYWYIRGNTQAAGTDGSIVLIQSALERLSWEYHVNIQESLSRNGFERLPAADCIKLLLSQAGIPLEVPTMLKSMNSIAKEKNFDGPSTFTNIRNRIVHPGKKKGGIDPLKAPMFECWNLGLWYLELLLLYIFEYQGQFANRLKIGRWSGQVEELPWNQKDTEPNA